MSDKYKGIKIPEEIIIVEKYNKQGYVVLPGGNLDNALNWAKYTEGKWIDNKWTIIAEHTGVVHTYKNGNFNISLYDSANGSSQGGKLSFWNCTIHAPDGKDFIIGINSDLLFKLMMNSTIINGDVQNKVWLGKEKNNTGVYFEHMEDFKQARKEDLIRGAEKSSKYEPMDIVASLEDKEVYLGKFPKYFEVSRQGWNYSNVVVTFYNKPRYCHLYATLYDDKLTYYDERNTKVKKILTNTKYDKINSAEDYLYERFKDIVITEDMDDHQKYQNTQYNFQHKLEKYVYGLIPFNKEDVIDLVKGYYKYYNVEIIEEKE